MHPELNRTIGNLIEAARAAHTQPARVSVSLRSGGRDAVSLAPEDRHHAASTMKLPVLIAAYRLRDAGRVDLSEQITVHNDFASRGTGRFSLDREDDSDPEPWDALGTERRLDWLCRRMIIRSSNLATDLVLEQVGFAAVGEVLEDAGVAAGGEVGGEVGTPSEIGTHSEIGVVRVGRAIGDFAAGPLGHANQVTTSGLNAVLESLATHRLTGPGTTAELLAVLAANEVDTDVRAGLPPGVWVAHKNGWIDDTVLDAALVRPDDAPPFALSVAVSAEWPNEDAHLLIRQIAAAVWEVRADL